MYHSPKISISIPVYNVEKHLSKCLDSIIYQTFKDIEIIVVDDGSTDTSGKICDLYATNDSRIKVIHEENGGLASARQAALEVARGDYFCACDADDWVELDMYEQLYQEAKKTNADIVMCDYWSEYDNGSKKTHRNIYNLDERNDILEDLLNGHFPSMVWNKIYKRELFDKYNISWKSGINLGEDYLLMLKIFQNPIKISYLPKTFYHYRREYGGNSYTNSISMDTFKQSLYIRKWILGNIDTIKYENGIFNLWLNIAFTGLRVKEGMTNHYYSKEVLSNIPMIGFFKYKYSLKKGLIAFIIKVFGYQFGRCLYKKTYMFFYK